MAHPYWPLFDLRVRTPSVELRPPTDDDLVALVAVAQAGVHDPATMPFNFPWTDQPSPALERGMLQFLWRCRAEWSPENWQLPLLVTCNGEPAGIQELKAQHFARLRAVETGSWLGERWHGQGIGKEMRAAVLHLGFVGLGAGLAYSAAFHDNAASLGVSASLGYERNGDVVALRREQADRQIKLKLERSVWEARRRHDIVIEHLEPCLDMFGIG
jgi:RimJ/RimL family protein N-acetyltransferase